MILHLKGQITLNIEVPISSVFIVIKFNKLQAYYKYFVFGKK